MKNLKNIISLLILSSLLTGCGSVRTDEKNRTDDTDAKISVKTDEDNDIIVDSEHVKVKDGKVKVNFGDEEDEDDISVDGDNVKVNIGGLKVDVEGGDDDTDNVNVGIGGLNVNIGKGENDKNDVHIEFGDHELDLSDIDINIDGLPFIYDEKISDENEYTFDTDKNVSDLDVDVNIGNINFKYSDDDKTKVSLRYTIYSDEIEKCEDAEKHIKVVAETHGKKTELRLVDSQSGEEFEKWLNSNIKKCYIKYDMDIAVPFNITDITAKTNIGNIELEELRGKFNCCSNIGSIRCSGIEFSESSEITCKTGSIRTESCKYTADTDISSKTGGIMFDLPAKGSGNANIGVTTKTGNIKVTNADNYEIIDQNRKNTSHSMNISSENCNIDLSVKTGKISIDKE